LRCVLGGAFGGGMAGDVMRIPRWVRWTVAALAAVAFVVLMILWLAGVFVAKIASEAPAPEAGRPLGDRAVVQAVATTRPYAEWAVGTTKAVRETTLGSRILAKVVAVHVTAGKIVEKNALLLELDDADLRAQLEQAVAEVDAAQAALDQAQTEHERIEGLMKQQAASPLELTTATNALREAAARKRRAEQARAEAQTRLGYTQIRAPMAGRIVDKLVDVGDTVTPGEPLVRMYDHTRMQLVAVVRESLAQRLAVGQYLTVRLDALNKECEGRVDEIVPQTAAASRSFEVKVSGPCPPEVYPGMFGRVRIPLDPQRLIVIPAAAVEAVGQLDLVDVVEGGRTYRRFVRLGRALAGGQVEVLSGLEPGQPVAIRSGAATHPSDDGG
jgi:membrane fusion protein (multidrug efflux system)